MTDMEMRRYNMLVRVRDFGQTRRDLFPEGSVGAQAFAAVATAVTQLGGHAVRKMSTAHDGRRATVTARQALFDRLDTIGRTARAIAEDVPDFDDAFRVPRQPSDGALLTLGRVFVQDAEAVKGLFVAHGLPQTFIGDLEALVETLERALREREEARVSHVAAHAGTESALLAGLAAVRKLDVIVANQCHADPVTMAVWAQERRVDVRRRPRAAAPVAPVSPTPPAPVPTPAVAPLPAPVGAATPAAAPDMPQKIAS